MADAIAYLPPDQQQAILDGPALPPPEGHVSQFDNPPNQNGLAYAVIFVCVAVSTICLLIRGYARIFLFKKLKLEDYLIFVGYLFFLVWTAFGVRMARYPGYFVHQYDIRLRDIIPYNQCVHFAGIAYAIAIPLIKIAILIEWTRMLVPTGTRNSFLWACYGLMGVQCGILVSFVFALCFICSPYERNWDFTIKGHCRNSLDVGAAAAGINLFVDIIMLVLPQKVIWGLQLSLKKKLGVSFFFSLGILACVSAAFRLSVSISFATVKDTTFSFGPVMFWAFAEMACGFIIACMPSTPKILKDHGVLDKLRRAARSFVGLKNSRLRTTKQPTTSSVVNQTNTYRKIDEFGVPMKDLQPSESTEQLREDGKFDQGILRTTRVTVQQEYVSDTDGNAVAHNAPWQRDRV